MLKQTLKTVMMIYNVFAKVEAGKPLTKSDFTNIKPWKSVAFPQSANEASVLYFTVEALLENLSEMDPLEGKTLENKDFN